MLDRNDATRQAALEALRSFPQGLQIGGGVTPSNALQYLEAGASHVIVTSYVFREGQIDMERLQGWSAAASGQLLVLLSLVFLLLLLQFAAGF